MSTTPRRAVGAAPEALDLARTAPYVPPVGPIPGAVVADPLLQGVPPTVLIFSWRVKMAGKRITFALTAAFVVFGIAACGGASPPSGMPEPDDPMMGRTSSTAPGTGVRLLLSSDSSRV